MRHYDSLSPTSRAAFNPAAYSLSGFFLAQLAIGVLGIVVLPSVAGQAIIGRTKFVPPDHLLSQWAGFAVLCAYAAGILIAAAVTLNRRDA